MYFIMLATEGLPLCTPLSPWLATPPPPVLVMLYYYYLSHRRQDTMYFIMLATKGLNSSIATNYSEIKPSRFHQTTKSNTDLKR